MLLRAVAALAFSLRAMLLRAVAALAHLGTCKPSALRHPAHPAPSHAAHPSATSDTFSATASHVAASMLASNAAGDALASCLRVMSTITAAALSQVSSSSCASHAFVPSSLFPRAGMMADI